jgi:hypothetical protein
MLIIEVIPALPVLQGNPLGNDVAPVFGIAPDPAESGLV